MTTNFNPSDHTITMERRSKQKDGSWLTTKVEYLPVQYRLLWFRLEHPKGKIESLPLTIDLDKGAAIFETYVEREDGGSARMHGSETLADWKDFIEKAETKSLGRALAAVGYGSQFTDDEFSEGERIVDTPIIAPERSTARPQNGTSHNTTQPTEGPPEPSQSDELQAEVAALKTDFEQLYPDKAGIWNAVLTREFGKLPATLTSQHLVKMRAYYGKCVDKVTSRRAAQEAVA